MLARGVRNVIYNYTDAQRKVRSATSNDAWGPSPALMHEIADLTDNVVAYAEIMPIIWKRLNDHGKNWRHVYKSLVLLDHLIKYGNERVSQQCKENIFSIQTLKDFQYVEDQKDQGYNVREKAKQLVGLLKDDERLRNERRKAQEARERYVRQAMGMDSNGSVTYGRSAASSMRRNSIEGSDPYGGSSYLSSHNTNQYPTTYRSTSYNDSLHAAATATGKDFVQPANQEEEQLQMQIALAESQREAEEEERRRRNDEIKIKIALERSVNEASPDANNSQLFDFNPNSQRLDSSLFDTHQSNTSYLPTAASNAGWNATNNRPSSHLGFTTTINDPWSLETTNNRTSETVAPSDPWQIPTASNPQINPWGGNNQTIATNDTSLSVNVSDPWGLGATNSRQPPLPTTSISPAPTTNAIANELSDLFGPSTTITPSYEQQQHASSNPWTASPYININTNTNTTSPLYTNTNTNSSLYTNTNSASPLYTNLSTGYSGGNLLYPSISPSGNNTSPLSSSASRKTPESFLGDKFSTLVNLDQLVTDPKNTNPFDSTQSRTPNPFTNASKAPTLDQLTSSNNVPFSSGSSLPPPLIPSSFNNNNTTVSSLNTTNPFL